MGAELAGDDNDGDHQLEELAERVAALALERGRRRQLAGARLRERAPNSGVEL